jgi:hypothetical protein
MQPSDSLVCVGLGSGRPVHLGLPRGGGFFFAEPSKGGVGRPRVPPRTRGASGVGHRIPVAPVVARGQTWASQVPGPSSSRLPRSRTPPGPAPPRPSRGRRCCRGTVEHPQHPGPHHCEAYYPRLSRSHAYASPGASPLRGARLATGLLGSALAGRASHPLDDEQNFVNLPLAYSFLTSLAWSHSTSVGSGPRRAAPGARRSSSARSSTMLGAGVVLADEAVQRVERPSPPLALPRGSPYLARQGPPCTEPAT